MQPNGFANSPTAHSVCNARFPGSYFKVKTRTLWIVPSEVVNICEKAIERFGIAPNETHWTR